MRALFLDLETRLGPRDLNPEDEERGWTRLREGEGGISALVIYDSLEDWVYLYDDSSLRQAVKYIESSDLLVTFYGEKFDIPVIEGVFGRKLSIKQHYDIYAEIAKENARRGIIGRKGDFKLDSICRRTLGKGKTGNGENVTDLIKEGRFGEIFNYCSSDVKLTKELFDYICINNGVQNINNSFLPLTIPTWIKKAMVEENK